MKLGFVKAGARHKGFVYDGLSKPKPHVIIECEEKMPDIFERADKEKAPVEYNAEWIIARSPLSIKNKVRELIEILKRFCQRNVSSFTIQDVWKSYIEV